tara:strand:- start:178 stop:384 length:207 start_codon:yes stop_codon:yes gene_type:complete
MRLLRTITIGIIALIGGLLLGLVLYVIFGGETTDPIWESWMYVPCYFVPLCACLWGMRSGWKSYEKPE